MTDKDDLCRLLLWLKVQHWLHRDDARERHPAWPRREFVPALIFPTLAALADWLDAQPLDEDTR